MKTLKKSPVIVGKQSGRGNLLPRYVLISALLLSSFLPPTLAHANDKLVIILDASGSMQEVLNDGTPKMKAAIQALNKTLTTLPPNIDATLRIYGGRFGEGALQKGPCAGSTRVLNYGEISQASLSPILFQLQPFGNTPISKSLVQAINEDLKPHPRDKWHIVLISDGKETCSVSPCKVAMDLVKEYPQLKINVVGFGQINSDTVNELNCISASTWGNFVRANSLGELQSALGNILSGIGTTYARILKPSDEPSRSESPSEQDLNF